MYEPWALGRLDEAAAQARRAEALAPRWAYHESFAASVLLDAGRVDTALAIFRGVEREQGSPSAGLAVALARRGQVAQARQVLESLEALWKKQYFPPERLAYGWAQLGEKSRALDWLELGIAHRSGWAILNGSYPWLAPLRDEPRFDRILATVGLRPTR